MGKLKRLFKRVVPESWERELAEIDAPPNDRFPYLRLIYEEGYPWEPVERYMIYLMTPARLMNGGLMPAILEQLQDPHPPSAHGNHYDTVLEEFVRNPDCLITERAWNLYRETGCWGRPYWVIQGDRGGHKRWFTPIEQKLLRTQGLPTAPPEPGDLPYAEWDNRVKERLAVLHLLKGQHGERRRTAALAHGISVLEEHEREQQKELREHLLKFLHDQVTEIAPDVQESLYRVDAGRKQTSKEEQVKIERIMEQAEEDFVTTGNSKHSLIATP